MGVEGSVHSMGKYFPHDVIIFTLGYKIVTCIFFCSMKFTHNRCVWSTVIIFTPKKHSFGNSFAFY